MPKAAYLRPFFLFFTLSFWSLKVTVYGLLLLLLLRIKNSQLEMLLSGVDGVLGLKKTNFKED